MTGSDPAGEDWNVGLLLFVPYRAMETRVVEALGAAGFADLTMAQARLVARLAPQGSRLTELADQARITKQTAGVLVDQLERHGYVQRLPDPTDGRARLVTVRPARSGRRRGGGRDGGTRWRRSGPRTWARRGCGRSGRPSNSCAASRTSTARRSDVARRLGDGVRIMSLLPAATEHRDGLRARRPAASGVTFECADETAPLSSRRRHGDPVRPVARRDRRVGPRIRVAVRLPRRGRHRPRSGSARAVHRRRDCRDPWRRSCRRPGTRRRGPPSLYAFFETGP